ncbi:MAG: GGDEF domain-containing protein [Candidatus Aminicenantes bacterium]|nr:GGDEF domain-containing protein [Candidatus Aminicenantes bacterium]
MTATPIPSDPFEPAFRAIEYFLTTGNEPDDLPDDIRNSEMYKKLVATMQELDKFVKGMAKGDLSVPLVLKGTVAGTLKQIQANLRHMTWQVQMIAAGDYDQRLEFMGEFSTAFNTMAEKLKETRTNLMAEIAARKKTEEALIQTQDQLRARIAEIESLQEILRDEAIRDALTGLYNRRYLNETMGRELARAGRSGSPVSLVMLDIDHFKKLNDTHGHEAGDLVLITLGNLLSAGTRKSDICCRFGGEEFVVILPDAAIGVAIRRAENWCQTFASQEIAFGEERLQATFSGGISSFPEDGETAEEVLRKADEALYRAKAEGRNRLIVSSH